MITDADRARADQFVARFEAAEATRVTPPLLLEAGPILDLYGEDVRARAFTTTDPLRGEAMLRPDFTVPVAQAHMQGAQGPARYTYAGEVFRRQEVNATRPREYLQAGFEIMGGSEAAADEAEVFALIADALAPWSPKAVTGDLGLLFAAVDSLDTSDARRAALRRHIPRPRRFRRLLDRYRAPAPARATPAYDGPLVGLRSTAEIEARTAWLAAESEAEPLSKVQADALDALLDVEAPLAAATERLLDIAVDLPGLDPAVAQFEARVAALTTMGVDTAALPFATTAGRGAMEYYDGFTFSFAAGGETVAIGGRYDALMAALGEGRAAQAVGGVIRPGLLEEAP